MTEERLGKISGAKFGLDADRPFMMGLKLDFRMSGSGCGDGGMYMNNVSKMGEFSNFTEAERDESVIKNIMFLKDVLKDSKVNTVDELVGIPVRVFIEDGFFRRFEILTEVL